MVLATFAFVSIPLQINIVFTSGVKWMKNSVSSHDGSVQGLNLNFLQHLAFYSVKFLENFMIFVISQIPYILCVQSLRLAIACCLGRFFFLCVAWIKEKHDQLHTWLSIRLIPLNKFLTSFDSSEDWLVLLDFMVCGFISFITFFWYSFLRSHRPLLDSFAFALWTRSPQKSKSLEIRLVEKGTATVV